MPELDVFFDAIDSARLQRVKELSEVKRIFLSMAGTDPMSIGSKSIVVLSYAAWEGFYNECVSIYLDFLTHRGLRIVDTSWSLLTGVMSDDFKSLRDRNHSDRAKYEFIQILKERLVCGFEKFDRSVVLARSNLDFNKLSSNFFLMALEVEPFQTSRLRIDKELVGWRHGVAHGEPPDLTVIDVKSHISFASELLIAVADSFQHAILRHV
jgi:RiboL-PSP-HEPN